MREFLVGLLVAVAVIAEGFALFLEWRAFNRPQDQGAQPRLRGFPRLLGVLFVLAVVVGGAVVLALSWPPEDLH